MDKSYVTLEQHVCLICGTTFDSGAILMDKRLRPKFDRHTVTGHGTCPECQAKMDEGYVAMVGVDESKSKAMANGNMDPQHAHRTGDLIHIRASVWDQIFNVPAPEKLVCFCEAQVIDHLKKIHEEANDG